MFLPGYTTFGEGATMSEGAPCSAEMALLSLMDRTSYNIVQENGQRRYGPPPNWRGPAPPKGCEVFVGKIPRDLFEDELVPVFEKIGMIYEVRLMMDFSGCNRGYGFVMYTNAADAKRAIKELDNYEIRKNNYIGVCKSLDNCRLFVGGIPKNKNKEEILREMRRVTDDVTDVILYSSFTDKSKNRGFAFVEYENHRAAAMARRRLMPGKIQLWGQEIAADWADPEPEVDDNTMETVTVLYVRNLSSATTEDDLYKYFSLRNTFRVEKVKKLKDFAFIHYATREEAEQAMFHLDGYQLDGSVIEVTWAKPADRLVREQNSRSSPDSSSCSSSRRRRRNFSPLDVSDVESLTSSFSDLSVPGLSTRALRRRNSTPISRILSPFRLDRYKELHANPVPPMALNFNAPCNETCRYRSTPNAVQVLEEWCHQNNWGEPRYTLLTYDGEPPDTRKLYACRVVIPGLCAANQSFLPNELTAVYEEAKTIACKYVLRQLGLAMQQAFASWNSASGLHLPCETTPVSRARPIVSPELDLGQGDTGSLPFSGNLPLYAALQDPNSSIIEFNNACENTPYSDHGWNSYRA